MATTGGPSQFQTRTPITSPPFPTPFITDREQLELGAVTETDPKQKLTSDEPLRRLHAFAVRSSFPPWSFPTKNGPSQPGREEGLSASASASGAGAGSGASRASEPASHSIHPCHPSRHPSASAPPIPKKSGENRRRRPSFSWARSPFGTG